jgi:hypothetical protein
MAKNKKGSGTAFVLLIVMVIAIAVGTAWYVLRQHSPQTATPEHADTAAPLDSSIYNGWLDYCDRQEQTCFKYPPGWDQKEDVVPLSDDKNNVGSTLSSPDGAVTVSYRYPYVKTGNDISFYTVSVDPVPSYPDLRVVGGIYTGPAQHNQALFVIVKNSDILNAGLRVGETAKFVDTPRFELQGDESYSYQFAAANKPDESRTLSAAKQWFQSTVALKALHVLQSFQPQN